MSDDQVAIIPLTLDHVIVGRVEARPDGTTHIELTSEGTQSLLSGLIRHRQIESLTLAFDRPSNHLDEDTALGHLRLVKAC